MFKATVISDDLMVNLWERSAFAEHPQIKGTSILKTYVKVVGGKQNNKEFTFQKALVNRNVLPCDADYFVFEFNQMIDHKKRSRKFWIRAKLN